MSFCVTQPLWIGLKIQECKVFGLIKCKYEIKVVQSFAEVASKQIFFMGSYYYC